MGTLRIDAVGSKWLSYSPNTNYSTDGTWQSGRDEFSSDNSKCYMGFGFEWPKNVSLLNKKITSIKFFIDSFVYSQVYFEYQVYHAYRESGRGRIERYSLGEDSSTYYSTMPSSDVRYIPITKACPFVEYSSNRFGNITYNNRGTLGPISQFQSTEIASGTSFNASQIEYFVTAWAKGHAVGTPDYKGSYTTYGEYTDAGHFDHYDRQQYRVYRMPRGGAHLEVEYEDADYGLDITYPKDVNIRYDVDNVFTWTFTSSVPSYVIDHYELTIKTYGETETTVYSKYRIPGTDHEHTIPANTLEPGRYILYMYARHIESQSQGQTVYTVFPDRTAFKVIGTTDAPIISNVTNECQPVISWEPDESIDSVEIHILQNDKIIYSSGLVVEVGDSSYQVEKMLPNGAYTVEMRALNTFGYYTQYSRLDFELSWTAPDAPTDVLVVANNMYGVEVYGTPAPGDACYVVRRETLTQEVEVLGPYTEGFTDYTAKGNVYYEYTLRNVAIGYADGTWQMAVVNVTEVVLQNAYDPSEYVELSMTDNVRFDVLSDTKKSKSFVKCLGRTYPVKEMGEWITASKKFNAYVSDADFYKLNELSLYARSVYFKATDECITCDIEIKDRGRYVSSGRLIEVSITQIDAEGSK